MIIRRLNTRQRFIVLFLSAFCHVTTHGQIAITQTWNGAALDGREAVLAARTDGEIEECVWTHIPDSDRDPVITVSSKSDKRDLKVEIINNRDEKLCKLVLSRASIDEHGGFWNVVVHGRCSSSSRRNKRQVPPTVQGEEETFAMDTEPQISKTKPVVFPTLGISHASGGLLPDKQSPKVSFTKDAGLINTRVRDNDDRDSDSRSERLGVLTSECGIQDRAYRIELRFLSSSDNLIAIPGQDNLMYVDGESVTLTARTHKFPERCAVFFDGKEVVVTSSQSSGGDQCNKRFKGTEVCVKRYESKKDNIFACNADIESMNNDLTGEWGIEVKNGNDKKKAFIQTSVIELPEKMALFLNKREMDKRTEIEEYFDGIEVDCAAKLNLGRNSRGPKPRFQLYAGKIKILPSRIDTCDSYDDYDYCQRFTFPALKFMDGENLLCVAHYNNFESFDNRQARVSAGVFRFREFAPTPTNIYGQEIQICARNKLEGDSLDIEIEIESDPEPEEAIWYIQQRRGRNDREIIAGERRERGYEAKELFEEDNNIYIARLIIDKLDEADLDVPNNHRLMIRNEFGEVSYNITLQTRDCSSSQTSSGSDYQCEITDRDLTDCRCDGTGSKRKCCDASSRCRSGECCRKCTRREEDDGDCNLCDRRGGDCSILDDDDRDDNDEDRDDIEEDRNDYTCRLSDRDCRCDGTGSNRKCCDASSRCRSGECCRECTRREERDRDCNLCDRSGEECMILDDDDNDRNTNNNDYTCRLSSRDCRCDIDDDEVCCDNARSCRGDDCCVRCDSDEREGRGDCKICDEDKRNCMKLVDSRRTTKDEDTRECRDRDRDCICFPDEDYCCSTDKDCRGKYCCDTCDPDDDEDCVCKDSRRKTDCFLIQTKTADEDTRQCREGDRDCVCLADEDYCCSNDRDCRGKYCCDECDPDYDDHCECKDLRKKEDCYFIQTKVEGGDTRECRDRDRDCVCFPDEDYCCSTDKDCRGKYCCDTCDPDDDNNCVCKDSRRKRDCFLIQTKTSRSSVGDKATRILLDSCLEMSATLLEVWSPDGSRRSNTKTEREFSQDLEDFFTTAKCTKFDRDIQDYVEDPDRKRRNRNSPLLTSEEKAQDYVPVDSREYTKFVSLNPVANPPNKVQKVSSKVDILPVVLQSATKVQDQKAELSRQEKRAIDEEMNIQKQSVFPASLA